MELNSTLNQTRSLLLNGPSLIQFEVFHYSVYSRYHTNIFFFSQINNIYCFLFWCHLTFSYWSTCREADKSRKAQMHFKSFCFAAARCINVNMQMFHTLCCNIVITKDSPAVCIKFLWRKIIWWSWSFSRVLNGKHGYIHWTDLKCLNPRWGEIIIQFLSDVNSIKIHVLVQNLTSGTNPLWKHEQATQLIIELEDKD